MKVKGFLGRNADEFPLLMGKRIFLSGIFGSVLLFTRNDEWAKMGDVPQKRSRGYRQEEEEIVKREWEMERKREREVGLRWSVLGME